MARVSQIGPFGIIADIIELFARGNSGYPTFKL